PSSLTPTLFPYTTLFRSSAKRATEYLADRAIKFMESNREKPFFLYLCPSAVHIPLTTTPELQKKYEAKPKVTDYSCHPLYAGLLDRKSTRLNSSHSQISY